MAIIPIGIGAAIAALAGGVGQGIARKKRDEQHAQDKTLSDFIGSVVQGNGDPAVLGSPEMEKAGKRLYGEAWPLVGQAARYNFESKQKLQQAFLEGGTQPGGQATVQPTGGVPGAVGEVPGGITADPSAPSQSRTMTLGPGGLTMSRTATQPSGADLTRLGMEQERLGFAREGEKRATAEERRKQQDFERNQEQLLQTQSEHLAENMALAKIKTLILEAATTDDPTKKQALYQRMLAESVGANIKDPNLTMLLKAGLDDAKKKPTVDMGNPHERDWVADNGTNPKTLEPVDDATRRQAVNARDQAEKRANDAARAMMDLRTEQSDIKKARTGAIAGLQKDSDDLAKFSMRMGQLKATVEKIRGHLDVYSTTVVGAYVGAATDKIMQTTRGQDILALQQALQILQSQEPRVMGGELGKITQQIENQWRETLPYPTKMTRGTTKKLLDSTMDRIGDMVKARDAAIKVRARQARGLGVDSAIVDMFERGENEALGRLLPEAAASGSIPAELALPKGAKMEGGQIISESGKFVWDGSAWKPR